MTDQCAAAHIERGDAHAEAFGLRRIDQSAAGVGNKVRFPVDKTADFLSVGGGNKIIGLAVEAVIELIITAHHKRHVVKQIDHQRRAGDSEKDCRLVAAVDHAMARVEGDGEQAALMPFKVHLALVVSGRPNLRRADAFNDVNQFFLQMIFRLERASGGNFAHVHAGEALHAGPTERAGSGRPRTSPGRRVNHTSWTPAITP